MKTKILGVLGGIAILLSAGSVYAGGPPPKPEQISFTFTEVEVPINYDQGTCDPSFLPYPGEPACVAYASGEYTLAGDLVGTEFEEDSLAYFANGTLLFTGYGMYTGTLKGRGTGSFVALDYDGIATPSGVQTGKLRIVDGTGTGDLVGISGSGSYAGPYPIPATMTVEFPGPPEHH
jgi:hypothetical protein